MKSRRCSANRTNLELKPKTPFFAKSKKGAANRTNLELKQINRRAQAHGNKSANRTNLELKLANQCFNIGHCPCQSHQSGIETLKEKFIERNNHDYQSHQSGIETIPPSTQSGPSQATNRTNLELKPA